MIRFSLKRWCVLASSVLSIGFTAGVFAGGFQLWEESGAGTGDYHAGGSAEANDASTEFYNPAGMIRLKKPQVSFGGAYIPLRVKFDGQIYVGNASQGSTNGFVNGGTDNFVPNFHIVYPVSEDFALGFGVTIPFGLKTQYPDTLPVGLAATLTNLQTVNLNPNMAFKVTNKLSFGLGVDYLYGKAEYNQLFLGPTRHLENTLTDWSAGWNTGLLYQFTPKTRMGLSYRSEIVFRGRGTSEVQSLGLQNTNLTATMNLPPSYILSFYSDVTKKWAVLASAYYTQWSVFNRLHLVNTVIGPVNDVFNYKNSWNLVLGAHYKINKSWLLKWGVAWDQTPTQDGYRDIRLPDADRYVVALGVHWQITKRIGWDLGATHFFTGKIKVDSSQSGSIYTEKGTARNNTNVVGTQLSINL